MATDRVHKLIAQSGLMSRRKAEAAIAEGRVAVDGIVFIEMGRVVDPSLEKNYGRRKSTSRNYRKENLPVLQTSRSGHDEV